MVFKINENYYFTDILGIILQEYSKNFTLVELSFKDIHNTVVCANLRGPLNYAKAITIREHIYSKLRHSNGKDIIEITNGICCGVPILTGIGYEFLKNHPEAYDLKIKGDYFDDNVPDIQIDAGDSFQMMYPDSYEDMPNEDEMINNEWLSLLENQKFYVKDLIADYEFYENELIKAKESEKRLKESNETEEEEI